MKYSINLLSGKEVPPIERVMYFFLNYLRYIIIITQLVVIGVFFYRFQIDQSIIDLKESVDQKKEIVQVVLPLLNEAESINQRTSEAEKILMSQKKSNLMMQYFLSVFPESVNLENLEVNTDSLRASGSTIQPRQLQSFYSLLKKEGKFGIVDLQNLRKTDIGFSFVLNLKQFNN